jgi:ribosomal protein S18 acetylase RimI-like enzyme
MQAALQDEFARLHSEAHGCGWCQCVAWWVRSWDGWSDRGADANRALRRSLFEAGEYDGYLLFDGTEPVGWAQVGPRDRLAKLVAEYGLDVEPGVWAITCLLLAPDARGRGWARRLVEAILRDLPARGVETVEAFPRRGDGLEAEAIWTGPERLFIDLGFQLVQEHPRRPRYRRSIGA